MKYEVHVYVSVGTSRQTDIEMKRQMDKQNRKVIPMLLPFYAGSTIRNPLSVTNF